MVVPFVSGWGGARDLRRNVTLLDSATMQNYLKPIVRGPSPPPNYQSNWSFFFITFIDLL